MMESKKLCLVINGSSNTGKSSILSNIFYTPLAFDFRKKQLPEGIYHFYDKKILLLQYSMEESGRKIEDVIGSYDEQEYDAILVPVRMNKRKKNHTLEYLIPKFDVKIIGLENRDHIYVRPQEIAENSYEFIEPIVKYTTQNENEPQNKISSTSNKIREILINSIVK